MHIYMDLAQHKIRYFTDLAANKTEWLPDFGLVRFKVETNSGDSSAIKLEPSSQTLLRCDLAPTGCPRVSGGRASLLRRAVLAGA